MGFEVLTGINDGREIYQLMVNEQFREGYNIGDFEDAENLGKHIGERMFMLGIVSNLGFNLMGNKMYNENLGEVVETKEGLEPYQDNNLLFAIMGRICSLDEERKNKLKKQLEEENIPILN